MLKLVVKSFLGPLLLAPTFAWADEVSSKIYLLANRGMNPAVEVSQATYATVDEKLGDFFRAQNLETIKSIFATNLVQQFSESTLLQAIRSANLSIDDFAISYSILPEITENSVSRVLKAKANGSIYNAGNQEILATFSILTPENTVLSKDKNICSLECLSSAVSNLENDLARQMSFVLAQKISFIQEERVETDTTSADAIKQRLSKNSSRKIARKVVQSNLGDFQIDVARSINIEVYFEFDSAVLTSKAIEQLQPLGEALSTAELGSSEYLVIGHTDAKGSAKYNQQLSQKRAASVTEYLVENFPVQPDSLVGVGLGETHLKRPAEPNAAINRRVEVSLLLSNESNASDELSELKAYTLTFTLFATLEVLKIIKSLEGEYVREVELLKSNSTSRTYSIETYLSVMALEEALLMTMMDLGMDVDQTRITIRKNDISVENL